jgi:thiamine biosynthesis lipoprotein
MRRVHRFEEQWGTVISADVRDLIDVSVIDGCFAWFARVDDLFSTWRPGTEIMRVARGELAVADSSAEMQTVLELCEAMRLESAGAFDISFGTHACAAPGSGRAALDPSGVVKGWAVARAGDILRAAGASNFFVNAGGDVLTGGCAEGKNGWRVGIQHPWERDRVAAVLEVSDAAVATSGRYERGDHVFDPRTGRPASGLASVTVVGPDLALADAFATAVVVLGPDAGMRWLATRVGYDGMGITDVREVVLTPSFDRHRVS